MVQTDLKNFSRPNQQGLDPTFQSESEKSDKKVESASQDESAVPNCDPFINQISTMGVKINELSRSSTTCSKNNEKLTTQLSNIKADLAVCQSKACPKNFEQPKTTILDKNPFDFEFTDFGSGFGSFENDGMIRVDE